VVVLLALFCWLLRHIKYPTAIRTNNIMIINGSGFAFFFCTSMFAISFLLMIAAVKFMPAGKIIDEQNDFLRLNLFF
jgi:tellurite resistance protein TehA-like permease